MTMGGMLQPQEPSWEDCMEMLDKLPSMPLDARLESLELLFRNSSPGIRERALRVGAAILPDDKLVAFLRDDADAVLRNAALEMVKAKAGRGYSLAVNLLKDSDGDVVLQAVLILDHGRDPRALEPLRAVLYHGDTNVVQAAIEAIGNLGDARAVPDLLPFLENDPWLQAAAVHALGALRSPVAVQPLEKLLTDLMIGSMAAESLARIGGPKAAQALAGHWLRFQDEVDTETTLGFLAHALEGLPTSPGVDDVLRPALAKMLGDDSDAIRLAAARSLLALGPGEEDGLALDLLSQAYDEPSILPTCLAHRRDLVRRLLATEGVQRSWGFFLVSRFPDAASKEELGQALAGTPGPDLLDAYAKALAKIDTSGLAEAFLGLYLRLDLAPRARIVGHLVDLAAEVRPFLESKEDLEPATRLVLDALLGAESDAILERIEGLPADDRAQVTLQILDREDVLRELPWSDWLREDPGRFTPLAVEVAGRAGLLQLRQPLRSLLREDPSPDLIRTMGELGDRESIPILLRALNEGPAMRQPVILETLGRIGGPEARMALREMADSGAPKLARIAYKALSLCATEEDNAFFRQAVTHQDWFVRLACAEVLGRFVRPENLTALGQLAADPVQIVSRKALSFLES